MRIELPEGRYYGECLRTRTLGALVLSECAYPPNSSIPRHMHENSYLVFALGGGQEETVGTRSSMHIPSTLIFHPAGEEHSERIGPRGFCCLHVEFRPEWTQKHHLISDSTGRGFQLEGGRVARFAREIHNEFWQIDMMAPIAIEGLVLELLAAGWRELQSRMETNCRWLDQAEELIRGHHMEPLSLADVAQALHIHPIRLARAFRKRHRCSVGEYIRRIRVEHASAALQAEERPLAEIALEVGFADQAHFCRVFKRINGLSPGQYRRLWRVS